MLTKRSFYCAQIEFNWPILSQQFCLEKIRILTQDVNWADLLILWWLILSTYKYVNMHTTLHSTVQNKIEALLLCNLLSSTF